MILHQKATIHPLSREKFPSDLSGQPGDVVRWIELPGYGDAEVHL